MTDTALIEQVISGDREAFGELVRRHQGVVCGLAYHHLDNFADVEDVAQQAFLTAYQRLHQLREPSRFAGWLREIVRNECRMWQRRAHGSGVLDELDEDLPSHDISPEEASVRREVQQRVRDAIDALSPANRLAVTLYYLDGQSCKEVAAFLGVSAGTVRTRLHRARNELREEMMDMVAETLAEQRPTAKFTEAVRRTVPKRVVEPFEFSLPVQPSDTVFVYTDDASVDVRGTEDNKLEVRGRKVLFGSTAEEARARSKQIVLSAGRRRNVWQDAPHEGERWAGTGCSEGSYHVLYADSKTEWEGWKKTWEKDGTLGALLPELLAGEVVSVIAAGNRVDGLTAAYPLKGRAKEDFRTGYTSDGQSLAFGAAASVSLSLAVPLCANLVLLGPAVATVEDLSANLFVLGRYGSATLRGVQGNVYSHNIVPALVQDVTGDLWVKDESDHRGVEWEEARVRRVGKAPGARIRRHAGSVRIRCRNLLLDVAEVAGDIRIANEFGSTRLSLTGSWPGSPSAEVESVTGPVSLALPAAADDRLGVGVWTVCGAIDRGRWPTASCCYNTPETIYLGTVPDGKQAPDGEPADVQIRTRAGNVRVVRKG